MRTRITKRWSAFLLTLAMLLTLNDVSSVQVSAAKTPKLSSKSITLKVGASKKITVKNKPAKAKATWSSKNKKIAKVNQKGKITAVKKGSTKVTCKLTYKKGKKKVNKKLSVSVKVKAAGSTKATPAVTAATTASQDSVTASPAISDQPAPTSAVSGSSVSDIQSGPEGPEAPTEDPSVTHRPVIVVTKTPDEQSNVGEEHTTASGLKSKDNGLMRKELSSLDMISHMSLGWNLGNQMEESNYKGKKKTIAECETIAGNPAATQQTFDGLKSYGINTVRIPVAWSNLMSTDGEYTINPDLLDRVEEIVNYALNNEMYVIINEHWDGGWWGMFGSPDESVREEAWKKYEAIWTQVSERFKDYSDHLIFEGGNEELSSAFPDTDNWGLNTKVGESGFLDTKNGPAGTLTEDEIYETAAKISQKFVDIVRASEGNNKYRHLLIPGNTTAIDKAIDKRFVMPTDIEENGNSKLSVSVHIYEPYGYALCATSTDLQYRYKWGTDEDKEYLRKLMEKVKVFTDQGYGVIAGECGVVKANKDNIVDWMQYFFGLCNELHIAPVWWDEGHYFNREEGYFNFEDIGGLFAEWTGSVPDIPENAELRVSGISRADLSENTDPKVMYTWEGEFMRHTNSDTAKILQEQRGDEITVDANGDSGVGKTDFTSDGLTAVIDDSFWNISLTCDWSTIEEPCVRIYPMDNPVSQNADLQLGYFESTSKPTVKSDDDYFEGWNGNYIKLDKSMIYGKEVENKKTHEMEIKKYPWIWITTNTYTGASYVKIEICDGAYCADGSRFEAGN